MSVAFNVKYHNKYGEALVVEVFKNKKFLCYINFSGLDKKFIIPVIEGGVDYKDLQKITNYMKTLKKPKIY